MKILGNRILKGLLILLFGHSILSSAYAQQITIEKVKTKDLTYVLNSVSEYVVYKSNNYRCSVYSVSNESGSANQPGTDEVTHNLYIAVSEWGESPPHALFNIGPFYNPHNFTWDEDNNIITLVMVLSWLPEKSVFKFQ